MQLPTLARRAARPHSLPSGLVLLLFCCALTRAAPAAENPAGEPLDILLLSSYTQHYPSAVQLLQGLDESLHYITGENNLYIEYFDSARIPDDLTSRHLGEHLRYKYQDIDFDYILVWHQTAINFIRDYPDLFPDSRMIYFEGPRILEEASGDAAAETTWLDVDQTYTAAIEEMMRVYAPEKIYVILDLESDINGQTRLDLFELDKQEHLSGVDVEYLIDRPMAELVEILQSPQDARSAAIYLLTFSDMEGEPVAPAAAFTFLAERSGVPLFSFWQTLLGRGMVGGVLFSHHEAGKSLGEQLLNPDTFDSDAPLDTHITAYDWQALDKWGISPDRIPADAEIINPPENLLYVYRWYLIGAALIFTLLGGLSITLARALMTRNQALAALNLERQNLEATVTDRTRDLAQANADLNVKNTELQNTLAEIKTLKGFIPICSFCRKVRDDEGYWKMVEAYISAQTNAKFSHGICPDCLEEHYSEYND